MYMPPLGSKKLSYSDNMKRMRKAAKKSNKKATIKDVEKITNRAIKTVIEPRTWNQVTYGQVAQLNGNLTGHYSTNILDGMASGGNNGQYNGRSYKPIRVEMALQLWNQSQTQNGKYIKFMLVKFKDQTPAADFQIENLLNSNDVINNLNPGVDVYDPLCFRNVQQYKNYSIIKEMNFMVLSDLDTVNQVKTIHFHYTFPKKYVQQMDENNVGRCLNSNYRVIILCDNGNRSSVGSTLNNSSVSVKPALTGLNFSLARKLHYMDA